MPQQVLKPVLVYTHITENRRMTAFLIALFGLLLLPASYPFSEYLWATILMSTERGNIAEFTLNTHIMGMVVVGFTFVLLVVWLEFRSAEATVLRVAAARPLGPDEEEVLRRAVENLCIGAGLPQPTLYVAEVAAPNAFTVGLSPESAKLVVTRGLLGLLERRELEGVIAHELSHIGNRDTRLYTITSAMEHLLSFPWRIIGAFLSIFFRINWYLGSVVRFFVILYLIIGIFTATMDIGWLLGAMMAYVFFVGPLFGLAVRLAISWKRELLADADAYLLTRNPDALARALVKIASAKKLKMKMHAAMARMYIVDPLSGILSTHPPVEERISALGKMGSGFQPQMLEEAKTTGTEFGNTYHFPPISVQENPSIITAAFYGILAGTVTTVVLSILKLLLEVVAPETEAELWWTPQVYMVPGGVAAGVAAYRTGIQGARILAYAIVFGFISGILSAMIATPMLGINPEKLPLTYQFSHYLRSLIEVIIGALLGSVFGGVKVKR